MLGITMKISRDILRAATWHVLLPFLGSLAVVTLLCKSLPPQYTQPSRKGLLHIAAAITQFYTLLLLNIIVIKDTFRRISRNRPKKPQE